MRRSAATHSQTVRKTGRKTQSFDEQSLQSLPLNSLPALQCVLIQCVILYGQSGRADGPSVWLWKTPSPHFQFSTLMNHNQIIHKLPPRFQTNNMAQRHVWLQVWVCLVRKQRADELAQPGFGRPYRWKLHYGISLRCFLASLLGNCHVFFFYLLVSGQSDLATCGENFTWTWAIFEHRYTRTWVYQHRQNTCTGTPRLTSV